MSLPHSEGELISTAQDSSDDVRFRGANFQIKEIFNHGTRRSDEVRSKYERLKAAKSLQDVAGPAFVYDVPVPTSVYELVHAEAQLLASSSHYAGTKTGLDLLFYVTRTGASPIRKREVSAKHLATLGWRSISYVGGAHAAVLFAQGHAPAFPSAVTANPSFKRSANGRPPSPGWWYAVHFHQPGLGVLPLAPA